MFRQFTIETPMIAVIFEVMPAPGRKQEYLELAERLRPELEKLDGFISIERFESLTNRGKMLSLSIWRDEDAVKRWRQFEGHRVAQAQGRAASDPQVPGASGNSPAPNHVATSTAG